MDLLAMRQMKYRNSENVQGYDTVTKHTMLIQSDR